MMPNEKMTHEEYIASVKASVVDAARQLLAGTGDFLELIRLLYEARFDLDQEDPIFHPIRVVEDDLENIPPRAKWAQLSEIERKAFELEIEEIATFYRDSLDHSCRLLIERYAV